MRLVLRCHNCSTGAARRFSTEKFYLRPREEREQASRSSESQKRVGGVLGASFPRRNRTGSQTHGSWKSYIHFMS